MTKQFKRGLEPASWDALDRMATDGNNWWAHLLSLWVPSGKPADGYGLRLALRDGYLNLYRRGQSVGRVSFGPRPDGKVEATMNIHAKYVWGDQAPARYAQLQDRTVTCKGLDSAPYAGLETLEAWVRNAERWAGPEKCGVDLVVGNNPTVIDLEMGMPAWSGKKSALRVDMAALDASGEPKVVLWEAKPLNSGALRARTGPGQVVQQMADYKAYLDEPDHRRWLSDAYCTTCCALLRLAEMTGRNIVLHDSIGAVAKAGRLDVAPEPRLAVFQGADWSSGQLKLVEYAEGWQTYLARLRRESVLVAVENDPRDLRLDAAA